MMINRFIIILLLLLLTVAAAGVVLHKNNQAYPIPQFTDKQMHDVCIEEEIY